MNSNSNDSFPVYRVAGDPVSRGISYGKQAADRIRTGLANYQASFGRLNISWSDACAIASNFRPRLEQRMPDLAAEIGGIADGAGVSVDEIMVLNCRTEIIYASDVYATEQTDGCTGVIAMPETTASGHVLHAQNWDWHDDCADTAVVLHIEQEDGMRIMTQTEAGIVARCGINSSGVALTGNFLRCDRDNAPDGIPIPFVRRRLLEQTTLNDAMDVVLNSPKSFSTNLMISDADGECINFEAVPGETFWMHAENGLLVHANHFETVSGLTKVRDTGLQVNPCSLYRSRRVREQLKAQAGEITIDHIKSALSDKYGSPAAACCSPATESNGNIWSTVATILMDVTEQTMWIAPRPYEDQHSYTRYDFTGN